MEFKCLFTSRKKKFSNFFKWTRLFPFENSEFFSDILVNSILGIFWHFWTHFLTCLTHWSIESLEHLKMSDFFTYNPSRSPKTLILIIGISLFLLISSFDEKWSCWIFDLSSWSYLTFHNAHNNEIQIFKKFGSRIWFLSKKSKFESLLSFYKNGAIIKDISSLQIVFEVRTWC